MNIKIWGLDNLLSLPANTLEENIGKELLAKLEELVEKEADELTWVCVDEYEDVQNETFARNET